MPMLSTTVALRSSRRSPPSHSAITRSATSLRPRPTGSSRCTSAKPMAMSIRDPGVRDSTPRCGSGYRHGRRCWTPATSITDCFCPSCYTAATIRAVRRSDRHEGTFCATPTPIFQRPSRPRANTGCRSATHAPADSRRRGSSYRLRTIRASPRVFCDETPMPVLDPGRHRTRICQFWAHAMDDRPWGGPSPPAVAYVFADGRGTKEIAGQLTGFSGILQVDGYAAYKALARGHGGAIELAFCLAHARRKFVEVYKTMQSPFAREVIERLQAVYAIEAEIRGSSAEQRLAARRTRTAPLMEALRTRLTAMVGQLFSQSKLTEAINYVLNHWDGLTLFLRDGRVEVDTNTVERSMRPIAMGRRNSLFSGSEGGAESWAILASLVNTAKLHDLDPQAYLADVLERIVSGRTKSHQLHELLAWNWKT